METLKLLRTYPVTGTVEAILDQFQTGDEPTHEHEYLLTQAKSRLLGRSEQELLKGAKTVLDLSDQAEKRAMSKARRELDSGKKKVYLTDPYAFSTLFEEYDLAEDPDFPGASPADYFAILALVYTLQSLDALQTYRSIIHEGSEADWFEQNAQDHFRRFAHERVSETRELIGLISGIEFEGIFRRKQSRSGSKAKAKRYATLNKKVCDYVLKECSGHSHRRSAQIAYLQFQDEVDRTLNTDDPETQLAKWISKARKLHNERIS